MNAILSAITAACLAYVEWVKWQRQTQIDNIEDEIDHLAAIGDGSSKLRIERLAQRLQRKRTIGP